MISLMIEYKIYNNKMKMIIYNKKRMNNLFNRIKIYNQMIYNYDKKYQYNENLNKKI